MNQLKSALEKFVRTNDPARLFRRTRALLSTCDGNPPPLNEAIQRGHTRLSLSLIEAVIDMCPSKGLLEKTNENDETPLLIAARLNKWKLVEVILKNRLDLVEQKDNDRNNLLHLLACVNEAKEVDIVRNIFTLLPNDVRRTLLKERNKSNQTPMDIAQSQGNYQWTNILGFSNHY